MNVGPVILRELRAQAHSPATWRLRLLAAGLAIGGFALLVSPNSWALAGRGDLAFGVMNGFAACALALIGPALTADSISREKREGTLGLLFLTPLSAREIVLGKAATHALRGWMVWLAAAPVLLLPALQGGVDAGQVAGTLAAHAVILTIGLSSGLMASALTRRPGAALIAAYAVLLATAFTFGLFGVPFAMAVAEGVSGSTGNIAAVTVLLMAVVMAIGIHVAVAASSLRPDIGLLEAPTPAVFVVETPSQRTSESAAYHAVVGSNRLAGWFMKRRRGLLERRPLEWLFTRPSGPYPIEALTLLGVVGVAYFGMLTLFVDGHPAWIGVVLLAGMTLTAVGCLREERRTGMLEMFSVLPGAGAAVLRALTLKMVRLFLPAVLLWESLMLFTWLGRASGALWSVMAAAFLGLATLPPLGVWVALRTQNSAVGALGIAGAAWGVPFLASEGWKLLRFISGAAPTYAPAEPGWKTGALVFLLAHAAVGALAWWAACRALANRGLSPRRAVG